MKQLIIFFSALLIYSTVFSQAREYLGRDTITHESGHVFRDTIKTLNLDSTLQVTSTNSYQTTIGVNTANVGGYWTKNTLLPTKIYIAASPNLFNNVGIGTDTPYAKLQITDNTLSNATYDSLGLLLSNQKTASSGNQSYPPPIVFQGNVWKTAPVAASYLVKSRLRFVPVQSSVYGVSNLNIDFFQGTQPGVWSNAAFFSYSTSSTGGLTLAGAQNINLNVTTGQLDFSSSNPFIFTNPNANGGIKLIGGLSNLFIKGGGNVMQTSSNTNFAINDNAAYTVAHTTAELDVSSTFKGVLIPRFVANGPDSISGTVMTITLSAAGSGYTNGVYSLTPLNSSTGSGMKATVTVSGGVVTTVSLSASKGHNYIAGDVISIPTASVGGTGSGATVTVSTVPTTPAKGLILMDTVKNQIVTYQGTGNNWTGQILVTDTSATTIKYGNDYVFTGTTTTFTLPAISTFSGRTNAIFIKNRGSGSITLNSNAGSTLYTTSAQSTITIVAGAACQLMPDGTYFNVMYNQ